MSRRASDDPVFLGSELARVNPTCALAAVGHHSRAMGASFYLSRSPLAALLLPPLGQSRTKLLPAPPLAAPSATADRVRRAPCLNRPGARPCLPLGCSPMPGLYGKARDR